MRQTEFFVHLGHFLPFYLPNNLENQNFEKKKKMQMTSLYTKNSDHIDIWSAIGITFCHFGPFFAIAPQLTPKIKMKIEIKINITM